MVFPNGLPRRARRASRLVSRFSPPSGRRNSRSRTPLVEGLEDRCLLAGLLSDYPAAVLADAPAGYWRLGESSGTTAVDASGNGRTGTYQNGVTLGAAGVLAGDPDTAAQFDSVDDAVSVPDSAALRPSQLTIEAWVYADPNVAPFDAVVVKASDSNWNDGYGLYYLPGGCLHFFVNQYSAGQVFADFPLQQWVYAVGTYDGAMLKFYFNGVLAAAVPYSKPIVQSTAPLLIGNGAGGYSWGGRLDEVAVYGTALSAAQIAAHYAAGRDRTPPTGDIIDVTPDPRTTAVSSVSIVFSEPIAPGSFTLADLALKRDGGANLLTGAQTLTTADNITWTLGNLAGITGAAGTYALTLGTAGVTDTAGNPGSGTASDIWTVGALAAYPAAVLADAPTGYWRLGESSGTTAADSSGNGQTGTYQNGVTLGVPGAIAGDPNTAAQFDSVDDAISVPDSASLTPAQLSLEAWVYAGANINTFDSVVMKSTSSSWTDGYGLYYLGGALHFFVNHYSVAQAQAPIPLQQWVHVVGTYDGAALRLYLNGALAQSVPFSQPINHSTAPLTIGKGAGGYTWGGRLDEVAVYGTALSAAQVAAHYTAGTPPAGDIADVTPDPRASTVTNITIVFSKPIAPASFTLADLTLKRNGGTNLLTGAQTLTTSDNITWTLGNLSAVTGTNGDYVLTLDMAGVTDAAGIPGTGIVTDDWKVRPMAPGNNYATIVLSSAPAGYWRLGDSPGTPTAFDSSSNGRTGTYQNGVTLGVPGAIDADPDTAAQFDSLDDAITVADSASLTPAQLSLEAWVYAGANINTFDTIVMKSTSSSWTDGYGLYYLGGALHFFVNHYSVAQAQAPIPLQQWVHVVGTYDGAALRLYLNGALAQSVPYSQPINHSTAPLTIGAGAGGYTWGGKLDEVAVYGTVLSAAQVAAHYMAGTPLAGDIVDVTPDPRDTPVPSISIVFSKPIAPSSFTLADLTLKRNGGTNLLTGAQTLTTSDNITWTLGNLSAVTGTNGDYVLTLNMAGVRDINNPGSGTVTDSWTLAQTNYAPLVLANAPIGYWRLGESSGTTAADSSGNGQTGTYQNGVTLGVPGAIAGDPNTAAQFDSVDDAISVPDSAALRPAQLSLEAWVFAGSNIETFDTVVMKSTSSSWTDGYGLYYLGGAMHFFVNHYRVDQAQAPIPLQQWAHVVGTYDGAALKLYLNGALAQSVPFSQPIIHSTAPLTIGKGAGGYTWGGKLDEVAVYGTALSAAQVAAHYAAGSGGGSPGGAPLAVAGTGATDPTAGAQAVFIGVVEDVPTPTRRKSGQKS